MGQLESGGETRWRLSEMATGAGAMRSENGCLLRRRDGWSGRLAGGVKGLNGCMSDSRSLGVPAHACFAAGFHVLQLCPAPLGQSSTTRDSCRSCWFTSYRHVNAPSLLSARSPNSTHSIPLRLRSLLAACQPSLFCLIASSYSPCVSPLSQCLPCAAMPADLKASLSYGGLFKKVNPHWPNTLSFSAPLFAAPLARPGLTDACSCFAIVAVSQLFNALRGAQPALTPPADPGSLNPRSLLSAIHSLCCRVPAAWSVGWLCGRMSELCTERKNRRGSNLCLLSCEPSGLTFQQQDYNHVAMCNITSRTQHSLSAVASAGPTPRTATETVATLLLHGVTVSGSRRMDSTVTAARSRSSCASTRRRCATC